jgi:hypothetical protein
MPLVGGGLRRCTSHHSLFVLIGRRNGCLLVVELPFIKDKVCEILNDIMVYVFHEGLDGGFWNF